MCMRCWREFRITVGVPKVCINNKEDLLIYDHSLFLALLNASFIIKTS